MAFYIVSAVFGICITIFLFGLFADEDEFKFFGLLFTILVGLFGFALLVPIIPDHTKANIIENFKFAKTGSHVIIELPDGYTETFGDAATFNEIDKAKNIFDKRVINFYGFEVKRYITLKK